MANIVDTTLLTKDECYALRKEFQDLQSSPGWLKLVAILQAQVDRLQTELIYGSPDNPNILAISERVKGKMEGRLSVEATLTGILVDIEEQLKSKQGDSNADS